MATQCRLWNIALLAICLFGMSAQAATSVKIVSLNATDLVYDPFSQRLYATVPSASASHGNSIAIINPATGAIEGSVFVGSEPQKMAISEDGTYIYIGLNGASSVSRFHIPSKTVDKTFSLGISAYVEDVDVQPGNPKVIAVSRYHKGISPRHGGVAIYDDGVMRPQTTSSHTGSNVIEFSDSPSILYGYCNESTAFTVYKNIVNDYGISTASSYSNLIGSFSVDFEYDNGFLYTTIGRVINTQTMQLAGQFGTSGKLEPDSTVRRTFYVDGATVKSFNQTTFLLDGQYTAAGVSGSARNLVRWGSKGLAFSNSSNQVVILDTDIVPNPPTLTSLVIEGPSHLMGYKGQYKLVASFNDGVVLDVTQKSRWSTEPDTYTSINNSGILYVFGTDQAGAATIKTEYMFAGALYAASKDITFDGLIPATGNLVRLQIDGPRQVLQDSSVQMTATAFFDDNTQFNVTSKVAWRLSNTQFAAIDTAGLLTLGQIDRPRDLVLYASFGYKDVELETNKTVIVLEDESQMSGSDWPTYQGNPQHTGYIPIALDPDDFSLRWTNTIPGIKPVSAASGRVFVTSGSSISCLDARDGETLWSKAASCHHQATYAYGNLYVQTDAHSPGYLRCFAADTGDQLFASTFSQQWDTWWAPVVYDGGVYIGGGYYGGADGYNAFTGEKKWNVGLAQYDEWTPALQGNLVFAYVGGNLIALDREYGTTVFTIKDANFSWQGWSMNLAPVIGERNDVFAIYNGRLKCFDIANKNISWEITGTFQGQPSIAEGVVYAVNNGTLEARDEISGGLLWSWTPPEGALKSPMIATQSHVIACTAAKTYAIEILSRQSDWSYPASGHLALGNDTLYIAASNGVLTAIATPEYIPAEPVKLEIDGPTEIFESSTNTYHATVTYSDGRVRDRTALCSWTLTQTPLCVFDQGTLSTGELQYPQETVTLHAEYTQDSAMVADDITIIIRANCTTEKLVARNLAKALQSKEKILYELQQALQYEKASSDIIIQMRKNQNEPAAHASKIAGIERPDLNKARNQIGHAILFEQLSDRMIKISIQDIVTVLKIFAPDSVWIEKMQDYQTKHNTSAVEVQSKK